MADILEVEGQLEAAIDGSRRQTAEDASCVETASAAGDSFYSSKKSSTWKKYYKKLVKPHKEGDHASADAAASQSHSNPLATTSAASNVDDDAASEITSTDMGRGSRMSMRYEFGGRGEGEEGDRKGGSLKSMFKKNKKSKQIELDALRFEMGMLQERHDLTERDLATYRHEANTLQAERDQLANQMHELTNALTGVRTELETVEYERDRLKELHSQVKAALQESYSSQQQQQKQLKELEELCAAQQNSLEEAEERYRSMQQDHDQLHHTALAAKAQLVTAQAQLAEARGQREELLTDLANLTSQATALQAEIDSRDEKMNGLEQAAEQANNGLEAALTRLRELEAEQLQLESRVMLLQEENLEFSTELSGVTELRRQLEVQLSEATASNASLQSQLDRANANLDTLTARLTDLTTQLANSSELGGSLKMQNTELLNELAILREQQQQRKQGSPLAKWRKSLNSKPAAITSSSGATANIINGSASNGNSNAGATSGAGTAADATMGFSPMTAQLPAVRPAAALHQWQSDDDTTAQALAVNGAAPQQADSLCTVTVSQVGAAEPAAGAMAAVAAGGADANAADSDGLLKPPVVSSSPDLGLAKGPLTASRPGSRRPTSNAGKQPQQQQQQQQPAGPDSAAGTHRKLSYGVDKVTADGKEDRKPQQDLFARLFTCLHPRVNSMQKL